MVAKAVKKKRKPKATDKALSQYRHAKQRAQERYGIILDENSYRSLCQNIQAGIGTCLGKQSLRLTVWQISAEAFSIEKGRHPVLANVVYDKVRHSICTFLPRNITDAKGVKLDPL
jgi:hypothetical protein